MTRRANPHGLGSAPAKVSADDGSTMTTLANLWPYIWPEGRADLAHRVLADTGKQRIAELVEGHRPVKRHTRG